VGPALTDITRLPTSGWKEISRDFFDGAVDSSGVLRHPCASDAQGIAARAHGEPDEQQLEPEQLVQVAAECDRVGRDCCPCGCGVRPDQRRDADARVSPENIRGEWLDGATGPTVGARFKGTNKLGSTTWSTKPTVTAAEPGRRFAFKVPGSSGALWTYELASQDGVTVVTESMVQQKASSPLIRWFQRRAGVTDRAANLRSAMTTTLERVAVAAQCQAVADCPIDV